MIEQEEVKIEPVTLYILYQMIHFSFHFLNEDIGLHQFCLTMMLYWIVYKFRFIYFVITKSLSLTETPEKIKVFWRYIGEK